MQTSNSPKPVLLEEEEVPPVLELLSGSNQRTGDAVRRLSILLLIVAGVGLAAWKIHANLNFNDPATSGSGRRQSAGDDRIVPIVAVTVEQKTMPIYLTALGTVTPYNSVAIKSRVDGQLTAVDVREGQRVKKGQLLAEIDPSPYSATLAQAEGQLARDKAAAAYANLEAERYTSLFNAGVVSQDSQQTFAANAAQLAGAMQADQATIQAAKVNLGYTRITSPIDGVVGLRQVDPGNIVHATDATGLLLVTQLQPVSVIFTLPEDQLPQVQQFLLRGTKLVVEAYDRSQTTLLATGKLLTLDNEIDTSTGTDKVKAVFDNKDNALFPNQFVNVRLILQQRENTIVIPSASVQAGSQGNFVFVVNKGDPPKPGPSGGKSASGDSAPEHKHTDKPATLVATADAATQDTPSRSTENKSKFYVELRPITVDLTEGSQVIVNRGLAVGEQVVIDGMEKLKDSSRVSPARDPLKSGRNSSGGGKTPPGAVSPSPDSASSAGVDDGRPQQHRHGQQP
jgi:multidrug efflux system membrane fusion protein